MSARNPLCLPLIMVIMTMVVIMMAMSLTMMAMVMSIMKIARSLLLAHVVNKILYLQREHLEATAAAAV